MSEVPAAFAATLQPPETMIAYCDESCHTGHRYLVLGCTYFVPANHERPESGVEHIEEVLGNIKSIHHLSNSLTWTNVPSAGQYHDGYKQFLEAFLRLPTWQFRCMVVDVSKYPLDHRDYTSGDRLVGYLKYYCVFLADGLMRQHPMYFHDIRIDEFQFRTGNDVADLERAVQGRFIQRALNGQAKYLNYCRVRALDSSEHNILQLTDLMVGATAFVWNGGMERTSRRAEAKKALVSLIQETRSVDLRRPGYLSVNGINVWEFRPAQP